LGQVTVWQLSFNSSTGETITIGIPRADSSLTEAQARAGMAAIIGAGVVSTGQGVPASAKGATLVTTGREAISL